jgi:site-specific recombinase XerD
MTPLRRRMIEDMQVRKLSPHTQRAYLQQVSLFSRHLAKSPEAMGPDEIRAYQIHLTVERGFSASSMLVVVSAIRFFYELTLKRTWSVDEVIPTCRKPQKLRTHFVQHLPQPQLPEMSVACPRAMARRPPGRAARHPVLPPRLHIAE